MCILYDVNCAGTGAAMLSETERCMFLQDVSCACKAVMVTVNQEGVAVEPLAQDIQKVECLLCFTCCLLQQNLHCIHVGQ